MTIFTTYLPLYLIHETYPTCVYSSKTHYFRSNLNLKSLSSGNKHVLKYARFIKQYEKMEPLKQ